MRIVLFMNTGNFFIPYQLDYVDSPSFKADMSSHKRPPYFFNFKSNFVHVLLWINVRRVSLLWSSSSCEAKRHMCLHRELNQRHRALQHAALTTRL